MFGYAPGWRVRCTKCGAMRDAGEAGLIKIKAWSWKERRVGWCSRCGWIRCLVIEKLPVESPSNQTKY